MKNNVRIIGGRWRGSKLIFPGISSLRPTPNRVRETLFNWLQQDITGRNCLDLFAGSGALGFEAASREAASVTLVERSREAVEAIRANIGQFNAYERVEVRRMDVNQFLKGPVQSFDIAFLDPPFGQELVKASCIALEQFGWLKKNAKIYVEMERSHTLLDLPGHWKMLNHKTSGAVGYFLFQKKQAGEKLDE